jgi:FtsZ-binding cell division protein ZapB
MNIPTRPLASDETIGETVKRKNIGDETVRESQIEMNDEKNERLSETIFMLMLELRLAKKEIKRLRTRVAEPGGLNDLSLIGGDVREKLDFYREKNEKLERENSNLRFQNDKFKNLEIEYNYFKESFTKIEELYMLEQQKRKFLENKLGELNAHEISIIEETFEEKFKYTHHVEEQYTQEVFGQRGKLMTSEGSTPLNSNLENSGNISLLSKNIQKKVKQRPDEYNLRAKDLEREIYILSKEVDRLNIENQRFIEENIILAEKLRSAGVDAPDFLSDKFVSGGPGLNPYGSELVEPSEIEIPDGKENFPQLLSNDNTFFMKERIEKLENQTEIYVETIKELEDKIDELKKKNIKLDNTLRLNMKDNARESTQLERENRDLKDKLENIKMKTQV